MGGPRARRGPPSCGGFARAHVRGPACCLAHDWEAGPACRRLRPPSAGSVVPGGAWVVSVTPMCALSRTRSRAMGRSDPPIGVFGPRRAGSVVPGGALARDGEVRPACQRLHPRRASAIVLGRACVTVATLAHSWGLAVRAVRPLPTCFRLFRWPHTGARGRRMWLVRLRQPNPMPGPKRRRAHVGPVCQYRSPLMRPAGATERARVGLCSSRPSMAVR